MSQQTPIKKSAGQTTQEMTAQLVAAKESNRLYNRQPNYKEISEELKAAAISAAVDHHLQQLKANPKTQRIDLGNVEEVRATAEKYMESCKEAGAIPSMLGFAPCCGYSRKRIYEYIKLYPESETALYLDRLRSAWAAILAQLGLTRQCSESVSIFLLKNCGQDLTDKQDIEIEAKQRDPLGPAKSIDELQQMYMDDMVPDA